MSKICTVKSEWLPLAGGRVDPEFWLEVTGRLEDPGTATADDVRAAIAALHEDADAAHAEARRLRDEAARLVERARELERMPKRLGNAVRHD